MADEQQAKQEQQEPQIDKLLRYKLIEEVRLQCRFAQFAYQNLKAGLYALDSERVFFFVHAFLDHALNLHRLFWPEREDSAARGQTLRQELKITEASPLNIQDWKSHLEQFDQRLEDWALAPENRNYVDMNIMPQGTMAGYKQDGFHRNLDPEAMRFYYHGTPCNLRQLANEIQKLEQTSQTWMKKNTPW